MPGQWIVAGDFNMEPETFGQHATARLPGVLVRPAAPTFRRGASVRRFDYLTVHGATARQILDVCVLGDSGIRPASPGPDEAEALLQRVGRKGSSDPESSATSHRWLRARTSVLGCRACAAPSRKSWEIATLLGRGAGLQGQERCSTVGDQEGGASEVSQQAQNGPGTRDGGEC